MKQLRAFKILFAITIITLRSLIVYASPSPLDGLDPIKLERILSQVAPWPNGYTEYSRTNWEKLIQAARLVEQSDPDSVRDCFRIYQESQFHFVIVTNLESAEKMIRELSLDTNNLESGIEEDGKLFLLLRILFLPPEHAGASNGVDVRAFAGWVTGKTEVNDDGTVNRSWPIVWNNGNPHLVSGYRGLQRVEARYKVYDEYMYFRDNYRMRKL